MSVTVQDPTGRRWKVRRHWVPRLGAETAWGRFHRRFRQTVRRGRESMEVSTPDGCDIDIAEGIFIVIALVVIVALAIFVAIPLIVAVVDLIFVLLLLLIGIVARVVFRRPWTVEAKADDGTRHTWRVVGWADSGRRIDDVATSIAAGEVPPPDS